MANKSQDKTKSEKTKTQSNQNPDENATQFVISPSQSTAIIASTLIGVGILTLPRSASEAAHEMGWLTTLLGGMIILPIMWVITKLTMRFPKMTVVRYTAELLGIEKSRRLGAILSFPILLVYLAVWFLLTASAVRTFGNVITNAVLRETPVEAIIVTLLVAVIFLIFVEVEVLARFNEVVLPLILIPMILIVLLSFQNTDITNVFPLFAISFTDFLSSLKATIFSFTGFTVMLVFMAFAQKKRNVSANLTGIAIPNFIYTMIVFSTIAVFGYEELQHLMWPTLELVKTTDIPGLILERVESLFLGIWVIAVYTTVGNFYYAVCFSIAQMFSFKKQDQARKWIGVLLIPLLYWIALLPDNVNQLFNLRNLLSYFSLVAFIIPFILYLIALIRKKGKEPSTKHESKQRSKKSST